MSLEKFLNNAISDWMKGDGPHSDIVISSRVRLARNLKNHPFSMLSTESDSEAIVNEINEVLQTKEIKKVNKFELISMDKISELQRRVLVEKHLISLNLANESKKGAVALSEDESISIMINEEDHIRIQCLYPGLQIFNAWKMANILDDIFELTVNSVDLIGAVNVFVLDLSIACHS